MDTVSALMGSDPGRGPVERLGVGGWGSGRYKGQEKLSFGGQRPRDVWKGGLNLSRHMTSWLKRT